MKFLAIVCALLVCGCSSTQADQVPLAQAAMPVPDNTSVLQSGDLRVSPLDLLDIKVLGGGGVDGSYQVDPTGQIKMPLLGDLSVKGYTTSELESLLQTKLSEKYLQHPEVTVRIAESNGQQLTIEGAIGRPGMVPVRGHLTLLQVIATSGGPSPNANLRGIIIFRTIGGKRQAARFDLSKIRTGQAEDPQVYGNDIIVIDGRESNRTYDEVLRALPLVGFFMAVL